MESIDSKMLLSAGNVPERRGCAGDAPGMRRSAGDVPGAPGMCRSAGDVPECWVRRVSRRYA